MSCLNTAVQCSLLWSAGTAVAGTNLSQQLHLLLLLLLLLLQ
jgi:hypothetical protein